MNEEKIIKILLLLTNEVVISEITEVAAEFGDPNCKLTNPYKIEDSKLYQWMIEYTDQKEVMINSDKIITIITPNKKYLNMYLNETS